MTSRPKPSFAGKITISSRNNSLYWFEALGGDLSTTIDSGEYFPDDLAVELAAKLNAASAATWTVAYSITSGKFTISATTGFYPKVQNTDLNNVLSGGHQDLGGNTLGTGEVSLDHCGFGVQASYPPQSSSYESDLQAANIWVPDSFIQGRLSSDDEGALDFYTVDAVAQDGSGEVLDFTPLTDDKDAFLRGAQMQRQTISFQTLGRESQEQFLVWFVRTWVGRGKSFYYYPDRDNTPSLRYLRRLTSDTRQRLTRGARRRGYSIYDLTLTMERAET